MFLLHFGFFSIVIMLTLEGLNCINLNSNVMRATMFVDMMITKDLTSSSTM
jgi:hypothetical protein